MKKFVAMLFLLAISLPALAQVRLSIRDQQRFDSYYSRWQGYRRVNDRDQIISMEKRMLDVYAHYGIPQSTPYWRVASNGHEWDQWRGQLAPGDQARFDSYYSRWIQYRQVRDREQVRSMEDRMLDVYAHYQIPPNTPYDWIASNARPELHADWKAHYEWNEREEHAEHREWREHQWRERLSYDERARFDELYGRWLSARDRGDRDDAEHIAHHMREIMERNDIPQEVRFEEIARR